MEEFEIEDAIEKKPTILGLKSGFFFIQVVAVILALYIMFVSLNVWIGLFCFISLGVLYLFLFLKTNDFNANRSLDKKVPTIIQCNPINEDD